MRTLHLVAIAFPLLAGVAWAQQAYTEKDGCFTLTVPVGWRATQSDRGTMLAGPTAGILINVGPPKGAEAILDSMQAFLGKQWSSCKEVERGRMTLAGETAPWRLVAGTSRAGVPLSSRLICVSGREGIVSLMESAAQKDYSAAKPVFAAVEASLFIDQTALAKVRADATREVDELIDALDKEDKEPGPTPSRKPAPAVVPPRPAPVATYRDPHGRFEVQLPEGWEASQVGDATTISRGDMTLNILVAEGARAPAEVVASLAQQVGEQWQDFQRVQGGEWRLAGAPAEYGVFSGVNPRGVPALMRILAVVAAGSNYVLLFSVPQTDWNDAKADLQRLEEGFSFGPQVSPPPAPGRRAALGVLSRDLTPADRAAAGARQGVIVEQIAPGSPAAAAGIQRGDIILAVGGVAPVSTEHLIKLIGARQPGDVVEIRILRGGKPVAFTVKLAARE